MSNTYSIYQIPEGDKYRDYRFEHLDRLHAMGLSVKHENYRLVYTGPFTEQDTLNSIYEKFNIDHPPDYKGRSLSTSDIIVLETPTA